MHLSHGPVYKFSSLNVCEGFLIHTGQTELLTKNYRKNWSVVRSQCWTKYEKEMELAWTHVKKK